MFLGSLRSSPSWSVPFLALFGAVVAIDPYDRIGTGLVSDSLKQAVAGGLNPVLWKLSQFASAPRDHILIGDSRIGNVSERMLDSLTGGQAANLGLGGASLDEVIGVFWMADSLTRCASVDISIGFSQFNDYNHGDRSRLFVALQEQPALYLVSRTVMRSSWMIARQLFRSLAATQAIEVNREQFWASQQDYYGDAVFLLYKHPDHELEELRRIGTHCRERGIALRFVVFPTYASLRERIEHSTAEYQRRLPDSRASLPRLPL